MEIAGLVANSTVDFPKVLSAVVFTRGCNMNCFYCHNRSVFELNAPLISEEQVWQFLRKRAGLLDGVVVSGGEPTLQTDLIQFIEKLKGLGYLVKLDTNGTAPEVLAKLFERRLLDYVAVDYKAPFERYKEICRNDDVASLLRVFEMLKECNVAWEVRTTMIPHITPLEYEQMAKETLPFKKYVLNRYIIPKKALPEDKLRLNLAPYTSRQLEEIKQLVVKWQPNVCLND